MSRKGMIPPNNDWKFDRESPTYPQYIEVTSFGDENRSYIMLDNDNRPYPTLLTSQDDPLRSYRPVISPVRKPKPVKVIDSTPKNRKFYLDE
jgi:hypothetical protein